MLLRVLPILLVTAVLLGTGCGHQRQVRPSVPSHVSGGDRSILAGEWEYEDGGVVALRLDEQGNGTYQFKNGRVETTQFGGYVWAGKWYQQENDREGGFIVQFSSDYSDGEGRWWYERIGANSVPAEKGGIFRLSRKTSVTRNLSDTPPPP